MTDISKIKHILFDLDGTLLPMDQDEFVNAYFKELIKKALPLGFEPDELISAMWKGTAAMVGNDGTRMNDTAFWDTFAGIFGDASKETRPVFDEFYANEFNKASYISKRDPKVIETVEALKAAGYDIVLATNPFFPMTAQISRIGWAGLKESDFMYVSSYENSSFCKPNPGYYLEICEKLKFDPRECMMVGNDAEEDMAAEKTGMDVFLITRNLINKKNTDINRYRHGNFDDLLKLFLKERANG